MKKLKDKIRELIFFLIPFAVVIIIWQLIVDFSLVKSSILPSPWQVVSHFFSLVYPEPILLTHLSKSFYRLIFGFILGACGGVLSGILMGSFRWVRRAFSPLISFFISVPTIAWVPILLIFLGIGNKSIIIAIFLGCFFPIVYNTMEGIKGVNKHYIWASKTMGAKNLVIFAKVLFPCSLVSILTGLRLGLGYSWRALVGAEMLAAASWGLGYMIYNARAFCDIETMFLGLILICLGGTVLDQLIIRTIEKKTIEKWGLVTKK